MRCSVCLSSIVWQRFSVVLPSIALIACTGQDEDEQMPPLIDLLPERFGAWTRSENTDVYDRETIFDYINGAGEVYRSYDFSEVLVDRYSSGQGSDVLVELFDMGSPDDAYGVFSYARESEEAGEQGGGGAGMQGQSESANLREWAASLSGTMRMIRTMEGSLAVTYKRIESPAGSADILSAIPENSDILSEAVGNKYSLTLTLQRDSRDYLINPSVGRLDRAAVEISRGDFKTVKAWLDLNQYFKTWQRQVLAIGLHGARIWGDRIPLTEMLYLGGANTLRGYSEDFFRGEGRIFANCEYRFLVSRDSQFFLLLDGGTVYNEDDGLDSLKLGYGVGMRLRSRTGLVSVDYGLARGDSILSGKVHVSLGAAF